MDLGTQTQTHTNNTQHTTHNTQHTTHNHREGARQGQPPERGAGTPTGQRDPGGVAHSHTNTHKRHTGSQLDTYKHTQTHTYTLTDFWTESHTHKHTHEHPYRFLASLVDEVQQAIRLHLECQLPRDSGREDGERGRPRQREGALEASQNKEKTGGRAGGKGRPRQRECALEGFAKQKMKKQRGLNPSLTDS